MTIARLTPGKVEGMINQTLTEIFDSFFSDPFRKTSATLTTQRHPIRSQVKKLRWFEK